VHLIDVVLRRTNHAFTGDVSLPLLHELSTLVGGVLGWSESRAAAEVQATVDQLGAMHGIRVAEAAATHN
jgi:glycerol-3-phosphate dehydrogenase